MALLGLGFSFKGSDDGLGKQLSSFVDAFKSLSKEILSLQRIQTFLAAISLDKLDQLGDKMQRITHGGGELVNSLESSIVKNRAELLTFGTQLGKTGSDLASFQAQGAAMARSLNISAKEAGDAIYGFQSAGDLLKSVGIENATDLAKVAKVAGVNANDYAYKLLELNKTTGIAGEGLKALIDRQIEFGTKGAILSKSLESVDTITKTLQERKLMGDSSERLAEMATDTYAAADGLYFLTGNANRAQEASLKMLEAATGSQKTLREMYAGTASSLSDFTTEMSIAIGSLGPEAQKTLGDAFDLMGKGPNEMLKGMAAAIDTIPLERQGEALEFFRQRLKKAYGDEQLANDVIGGLSDSTKRAAIAQGELGKISVKSMEDVKKGFTTGRDASEEYAMLQEDFLLKFRDMSSQTAGAFVADARKQFNQFGKGVSAIYKEGGPLSGLLGKMADIQKFGAAGLFPPSMQAGATVFGDILEKLAGPFAKLKALGIDLLSPMGLLAGAVGLLAAKFVTLRGQGLSTEQALKKIGEDVITFLGTDLPKYIDKGIDALVKYADKIIDSLMAPITSPSGQKTMGDRFGEALRKALSKVWDTLKDLGEGFWKGLNNNISKADPKAQRISGAIGLALRKAYDYLWPILKEFATDLWSGLTGKTVERIGKDGKATQSFANTMGLWLHDVGVKVWGYITNFAKEVWAGLNNQMVTEVDADGNSQVTFANSIGLWIRAVGEYVFGEIINFAKDVWKGFTGNVVMETDKDGNSKQTVGNKIGIWLGEAFDTAVEAIKTYVKDWWTKVSAIWADDTMSTEEKLKKTFGETLPMLIATTILAPGAITTIIGAFISLAGAVMGFFFGILGALMKEGIIYLAKQAGKWFLEALWPMIRSALWRVISGAWEIFLGALEAIGTFVLEIGTMLLEGIAGIFAGIAAVAALVVAIIVAAFVGFYYALKEEGDDFSDTWDRMMSGISTTASWYWDYIKAGATYAITNMGVAVNNFWEGFKHYALVGAAYITDSLATMYNFVANLFNKLAGAMTQPLVSVLGFFSDMLGKISKMATDHPTIASMLGMDADMLKNLQTASDTVKSMSSGIKLPQMDLMATNNVERAKALGPQYKDYVSMQNVESLASRQDKEWARIDAAKAARQAADAAARAAEEKKVQDAKDRAKSLESAAPKTEPKPVIYRAASEFKAPGMESSQAVSTEAMAPAMSSLQSQQLGASVAAALSSAPTAAPSPALPVTPITPLPSPLTAAQTTPAGAPVASMQSQLIAATDNPKWVAGYLELLKQQHAELLATLEKTPPAPAGKGATSTGAPSPVARPPSTNGVAGSVPATG